MEQTTDYKSLVSDDDQAPAITAADMVARAARVLLAIAEDPAAGAEARVSAAGRLLSAGVTLASKPDASRRGHGELTLAELEERIERAKARLRVV